MTTPNDRAEGSTRFRARTLSTAAFELMSALAKGDPPPTIPPGGRVSEAQAWDELVEAGIVAPDRALRPAWARVLGDASAADIAFQLSARMGKAGIFSTVSMTPDAGLSITERRRLQVGESEIAIESVEDKVEIALFDPRLIWPAIQRVLPPNEAVRSDPRPGTVQREQTLAAISDIPERSALPDGVRTDLASASVEVSLALSVDLGDRPPAAAIRHWSVGNSGDLLEVRLLGDAVTVVDVPAGTIAREVTWLAVGALELRAQSLREAS